VLGESTAVKIQILRDRRTLEFRQEFSEADIELVAAAVGEHPQLPCATHAGRDIAVAQTVAD
jgi:hypothetical protein